MCDLTSPNYTAYGICYVNIYGNNKELLYTSIGIASKETTIPVLLDIKGQSVLYIEVIRDTGRDNSGLLMKNARVVR